MKRAFPLLAMLLGACAPEKPEAPHIVSISPAVQTTIESKTVIVELDEDPLFLVDYGERSVAQLEVPTLQVGPRTVVLDRYLGRGRFEATVGSGMAIGTYDVEVSLEDGRATTLPQAYTVKPAIDSYWLEPLPQQIFEGRPITLTVHVTGPDALVYDGTVSVSINRGKLSVPGTEPAEVIQSGRFSNGIRQELLTLSGVQGGNVEILVKDEEGRSVTSAPFFVNPKQ